ncbi:cold-shock protein [Nitrospirillum sp. BR 11163]|uniref:cold-shock protein n=1 Tax=Nitrospirillum sp. BR 11163 TaxID=3104323 RepID=UPI002AFF388B|nr:cold-shock protein [Nitrospirillum sp. BR 11163]MEA1676845.1 cold-shock protein [Nitrospirillum sp. BR 11163]
MYERRSPQSPQITRRGVNATVKWYNPTKGFGFVTLSDGSPDAFLHASVVQAFGHDSLADGTTINCDLSQGQKGPQVAAIHSVDEFDRHPRWRRRHGRRHGRRSPRQLRWWRSAPRRWLGSQRPDRDR